jgi:hypothetical protein
MSSGEEERGMDTGSDSPISRAPSGIREMKPGGVMGNVVIRWQRSLGFSMEKLAGETVILLTP